MPTSSSHPSGRFPLTCCLTIDSNHNQEEASPSPWPLQIGLSAREKYSHLQYCSTSLFLLHTSHPKRGIRFPIASEGMPYLVANINQDDQSCYYSFP